MFKVYRTYSSYLNLKFFKKLLQKDRETVGLTKMYYKYNTIILLRTFEWHKRGKTLTTQSIISSTGLRKSLREYTHYRNLQCANL